MASFLKKVIDEINFDLTNIETTFFILPNKKSQYNLKKQILSKISKPIFSPQIETIDSLIKKISGIEEASIAMAEYEFYKCFFKNLKNSELKDFYNSSIATTFLKDASEIEQNLLDLDVVIKDLIDLDKVKNWGNEKSSAKNFQKFLFRSNYVYEGFKKQLFNKGQGLKGVCYAEAVKNIEFFKEANSKCKFIFIGLSALSKSEELIVQELISFNNGNIYWDTDSSFFNNKNHSASFFLRKYRRNWKFFSKNEFKWVSNNFSKKKTINIIKANGFLAQSNEVGKILSKFNDIDTKSTAVVLGDENLIYPVLEHIPENISKEDLNISVPLKDMGIKSMLKVFLEYKSHDFDHRSIKLLRHLLFSTVIKKLHDLKPENITRQSLAFTKLKLKNNKTLLKIVFGKWLKGIEVIEDVNQVLNDLQKSKKLSDFEYHEIKLIKNELTYLKELQKNSNMNIERAKEVLLLFISHTSVSIKASKASKLNILGLLETRALDFKRVIITSVNEGIMPAGKTFNSLIPQVLKLKYGMFGYAERDKIFSYHFYRLIQRAEEIFLIYSSNKEGVDRGEKSRFIYQLEIENQDLHTLVYPNTLNQIILSNTQKEFIKTPETLKRIEEISQKGFSPSSLEMYIKSPLEYYLQKILNINNEEDKHDYVSHKKIGLIFHEVLEEFYSPFIGKKLCDKELYKNLKKLKSILKKSFLKHHEDASYSKNKLIFEVIKNSIETFINNEISELKTNSEIMLVSLEKTIKAELMLSNKQTVFIKGIVDRVDIKNGRTRIVDYKTGAIEPNQLSVRDLNSICKMSSKSKAMQLMCYVWMYAKTNKAEKISPGIFSLRKLNKGFMKLNLNNSKLDYVSDEEIYTFENCLRSLVEEIMNPKIDFIDSAT
jgi:hypothetical protein